MGNKILYCIGGVSPSGAEVRLASTAAAHALERGGGVCLLLRRSLFLALERKHIRFDSFERVFVVNDSFGKAKSKALYGMCLIYILLKAFFVCRPKVIHVSIFRPGFFSVFLPIVSKYFYEITSPDVSRDFVRTYFFRFISLSGIYINKINLLCVSPAVKKSLIEYGVNSAQMHILHRVMPYSRFTPDRSVLSAKKNLVIFAHRLVERKNPFLAVNAFGVLAKKYPDWQFLILGQGALSDHVRERVSSYRCPNFLFKGYVDNLNGLLSESKIFVSLIWPDNYPSQSILEALSYGNALCLSDTGYSKQKFYRNNGVVCELSGGAVIASLEYMINSYQEDWGKNSQFLVEEEFGFNSYLGEHVMLLDGC